MRLKTLKELAECGAEFSDSGFIRHPTIGSYLLSQSTIEGVKHRLDITTGEFYNNCKFEGWMLADTPITLTEDDVGRKVRLCDGTIAVITSRVSGGFYYIASREFSSEGICLCSKHYNVKEFL